MPFTAVLLIEGWHPPGTRPSTEQILCIPPHIERYGVLDRHPRWPDRVDCNFDDQRQLHDGTLGVEKR